MSAEAFNIIVTGKRMIFAEMTSDLVREEAQRASKGAGFLGGIMAAATAGSSLYKRYLTMPPDAALNESPRNFSVDLSRIRKVRIEAGKEIRTYQSMKSNQGSIIKNSQTENGKLEIETAGETLKFDLPNSSVAMAVETAKKAGLY